MPWSRFSARAIAGGCAEAVPARTIDRRLARRSRTTLVVAQVTLAVVLLSAAGLMLTSVMKLSRVGTGFDADRVLTFKLALTGSNYAPARVAHRVRGGPAGSACRRRARRSRARR